MAWLLPLVLLGCAPEPAAEQSEGPLGREEAAVVGEPAHCVVSADVSGADRGQGPALPTPIHSPRCFKLFSEALSFATQGQVLLPEGVAPGDVETALEAWERSGMNWAHSHVIAIEYTEKGYRGASLTVQSTETCDHAFLSLNLTGAWNKAITSARVFGDCHHAYHYDNPGLKGTRADCEKRCPFIGDELNERASSIQWTE